MFILLNIVTAVFSATSLVAESPFLNGMVPKIPFSRVLMLLADQFARKVEGGKQLPHEILPLQRSVLWAARAGIYGRLFGGAKHALPVLVGMTVSMIVRVCLMTVSSVLVA